MTSVLIVDDEKGQVREMVDIVRAMRPDYEVQGVTSAKEALEWMRSGEKVDVVMTDIRMPQMDGLELIEQLIQAYPHLLLVILSGYGEFAYAKKAIEFGVFEYLVKPISRLELVQLFERVDQVLHERKIKLQGQASLHKQLQETLPVYVEHLLNKWILNDLSQEELQEIGGFFPYDRGGAVVVSRVSIPDHRANPPHSTTLNDAIKQVEKLLTDELNIYGHAISFRLNTESDHIVTVISHQDEQVSFTDVHQLLENTIDELEHELNIKLTTGMSEFVSHIRNEIHVCFQQGYDALAYHFFRHDLKCIPFHTIRYVEPHETLDFYKLETELAAELQRGNHATVYGLLDDSFSQICGETTYIKPRQIKDYCVYIVQHLIDRMKMADQDEHWITRRKRYAEQLQRCETCDDLRLEMKRIMDELGESWMQREVSNHEIVISQCKQYIEKNYMNDLSLEMLADRFHFNSSYLSNLFRTYAGIGYSEYLTKVRIEKAKELLQHTKLKVYEVSKEVGYNDSTYFIRIFKKETGVSPHKFRQLHSMQEGVK